MSTSFYITTPIYYVNGLPHIGHAYTTIAADTITRYHRLRGRDAFFLTGTDEHGQKVLEKARERGMTPKEHCDDMVTHWRAMFDLLNIEPNRFIRTTDADHVAVVTGVLTRLYDAGEIYKDSYEGWYHVGDEIFVTDKDVEEGKYDRSELQRITEANYFFKMSKYQQQLIDHIEANPDFIRPVSRRNEVLGFLRKELGDLCISRPKSRMSWGIDLPFDDEFVTYVWFDALLNYLTGTGYPDAGYTERWPVNFHLLGKDILTTHAVYWSTMLMAMGVDLPQSLFAHGWWTSQDGAKMSKSKGNVIDVQLLANEFGVDPTRYFLLREISFGADGGFTYDNFMVRYNADLANDLGNLAHRGLSMTRNWLGAKVPELGPLTSEEEALIATAKASAASYAEHMEQLAYNKALEALWDLVKAGNKYIDTNQPWALNKKGDTERLGTVMHMVLEVCYFAATLLLPVLPTKSEELLANLGRPRSAGEALFGRLLDGEVTLAELPAGVDVQVGDPLFPRFKELPAGIAKLFETAEEAPAPKKKKAKKKKGPPEPPAEIQYDDFAKLKLRVGKVVEAGTHPDADRLLVLKVDIGEEQPRQILAGIAGRFAPDDLLGRTVVVVANLAPRKIRGLESQGMLLAAGEGPTDIITVNAAPGEVVR